MGRGFVQLARKQKDCLLVCVGMHHIDPVQKRSAAESKDLHLFFFSYVTIQSCRINKIDISFN